jgi:hypothetical protein
MTSDAGAFTQLDKSLQSQLEILARIYTYFLQFFSLEREKHHSVLRRLDVFPVQYFVHNKIAVFVKRFHPSRKVQTCRIN